MKGETPSHAGQDNGTPGFLGFLKNTPILLIVIAVLASIGLVMFVDFEKLKEVSTLFVTGLVVFVAIVYFLKLVSEFFSKIVYGRKSNWKKDFTLNYDNPESEDSQHAHALAEKFSLGYLIYVDPESEKEKKIFLPVDSSFIVGRDSSVDIYVPSEYLSKSHFMIRTDKDSIYAVDLNSTNGTKINRTRIQPGVKTKIAGDSDLRAGRVNFLINVL